MKIEVKNISGKAVGSIDLDDAVFGAEIHEHLLYEVVKWQLAKRRAGTASIRIDPMNGVHCNRHELQRACFAVKVPWGQARWHAPPRRAPGVVDAGDIRNRMRGSGR